MSRRDVALEPAAAAVWYCARQRRGFDVGPLRPETAELVLQTATRHGNPRLARLAAEALDASAGRPGDTEEAYHADL